MLWIKIFSAHISGENLQMATQRKISGRVSIDTIRMFEIPRLPKKIIEGYRNLIDLTAPVSDAMDNLGLACTVPSSILQPVSPGKRAVGQAITVRNIESRQSIYRKVTDKSNRTGSPDAFNMAKPGDIIVIEGLLGVSNLGGHSATICQRQGCSAVVVEGSIRDPDASREMGFPVWSRGITPITGKWRYDTVEINGTVRIANIQVAPGDLVLADSAGVVFVPFEHAAAVLAETLKIEDKDVKAAKAIEAGMDVLSLAQDKFVKKR
jgi:4-hydroxy-4-methyl-2-oxoglutarate aldolase